MTQTTHTEQGRPTRACIHCGAECGQYLAGGILVDTLFCSRHDCRLAAAKARRFLEAGADLRRRLAPPAEPEEPMCAPSRSVLRRLAAQRRGR